MDKVGWPLIKTIIGGIIAAVVGGLIVECSKQLIPQLESAQKASILKSIKLIVRSIQGIVMGLLLGVFVVSAFFGEPVYQSIEISEPEGPLTNGAPKVASEPSWVPTGETKLTERGSTIILVFGVIGGFVGYFKEYSRAGSDIKDRG